MTNLKIKSTSSPFQDAPMLSNHPIKNNRSRNFPNLHTKKKDKQLILHLIIITKHMKHQITTQNM